MAHYQDEQSYTVLEPLTSAAIARIPVDRFSTRAVIAEVRATEGGEAAYQSALAVILGQGGSEHMAHLVVHGQVVPGLLRRSGLVRFAGFIHGRPDEDDGYGVPSWWQRL